MSQRRDKHKALQVPCPRCGAYEWKPCAAKDGGERKAFHAERHTAAKHAFPASYFKKAAAKAYGKDWAKQRARVFSLKGSQCAYCGADASHVDHRTPKSRGGSDDIANLEPCCVTCNLSKGTMTVEEWRA